jgi:hydroxymethylpyrimidine/phosphomethylpyrimidine kinase
MAIRQGMLVDLYLIELTVCDWSTALAWYRDRLGLSVVLTDEPNRYALLAAGPGRVAIKAGNPTPGTTKLVFHVRGLDAELARLAAHNLIPDGPIKMSPEGYRSARFRDPDGHRIEIFEWHDETAPLQRPAL